MKDTFQQRSEPLKGKHILVNAGPTRELIDPVRFISNFSTGKMGIAIADEAAAYGADVTLVLGPVNLVPSSSSVKIINVVTAKSMARECIKRFPECDIAILAAAVADYTPEVFSATKLKKTNGKITITLQPTTDIALELGKTKRPGQIVVGFALETDNELENARKKLISKNLDLIVLNSLRDDGAGFGYDTNIVTLMDRNNNIDKFELKSKDKVAKDILDRIVSIIE